MPTFTPKTGSSPPAIFTPITPIPRPTPLTTRNGVLLLAAEMKNSENREKGKNRRENKLRFVKIEIFAGEKKSFRAYRTAAETVTVLIL